MINKTTPKEYLDKFKEVVDEMYEITKRKNHDYSGTEFAFKNFETIEILTDWKIKASDGLLVRITDKLSRLGTLLHKDGEVKDEKLTDTIQDAANYLIILKIYLDTLPN